MGQPFIVGIHIDGRGSHPAAGDRSPAVAARDDATRVPDAIGRAETAGLAFATLAGAHLPPTGAAARLDPVQLAAFTGPRSSRIALIPEIPVTYVEPFHTATQLASLDYAAGGRGGWLVSGENSQRAARQFGRDALAEDELAAELVDVVAAVRVIWDTWEADAVITDFPTGRYIDRDKLHYADFTGRSFSVKGPAITPRPPQGQLPVLAPLASSTGVDADAILIPGGDSVAADAATARAHGAARVIVDLEIVLDTRGESARDRLARLDTALPWAAGPTERFVGTADELVQRLVALAAHVDGVRLVPAVFNDELDEVQHRVVPALIAAGVGVPQLPLHATAREVFGLPAALNAFANEGNH
ncbi:LLM class flavin-dependent oxidoreductase [Leucobacter japonicus]|uniref:LLM class flavin-dependent oxidoreductase n=1 Tax=Leucobacter japonicus TaxID=1461259 RepID=UPI0006A7DF25|nr:LLM class flavin-dependent oxidoreductase [Leucobacter japonicus]